MKAAAAIVVLATLAFPPIATAAGGDPEIAALQVGLRNRGLYAGTVDGVLGGRTISAVKRLQQRAGIAADGVPGLRTRAALGHYGRRAPLGRRTLVARMRGWDVAALQFALASHGFPSGSFDGVFGVATETALRKFQRWSGVTADGRAGGRTVAALKERPPVCPIALVSPVAGPYSDLFGPRGRRFHSGIDYPGATGTAVTAAAAGRVTFAGWLEGGWGRLIVVAHARGTRTMYAHLSRVTVRVGQRVAARHRVGSIGASGAATGPHLHFEVRLRGAAVDPLTALS